MDIKNEVNSLVSSAVLIFLGALMSSASGLIERVVLVRFLSQSNYGEVNLGITILFLGGTLAMFGFNQGIPRYMSRFSSDKDIRGAWYTGFTISITLAILLSGILLFARDIILTRFFENSGSIKILVVFALVIPFHVGLKSGISGIRGMEQTLYRVYTMDLLYPISRVLLIGVFLWAGLDVLAAGYAYLLAIAVSFIFVIYFLNRIITLHGATNFYWGEMIRFSAPLMIATVIVTLMLHTDTLMVGYFQSSADVGLYSAAYPLAQSLMMVISSFGFLYLPLASRLDAMDSHDELDSIYTLTTKWIYIVTFPAFLVFISFSEDVISIFFGDQYIAAASAFSILVIGFFTNAAAGRCRETISALGYTNYNLIINGTAFVFNFILNLILIPQYSYTGAAIASATAYFVTNLLAITVMKWKFDITPFSRQSVRVYALLPMILLPVGFGASQFITLSVLYLPIALVVIGIITLCLVVVIGGIQAEDNIIITYIEEKMDREIPIVKKYIPEYED